MKNDRKFKPLHRDQIVGQLLQTPVVQPNIVETHEIGF